MAPGRPGWWRGLLLAAILIALVLATGSWAVVRIYGPSFTREKIESALTEALDQPVRIGAVRLEPWLLRLVLADVSTGEPGGDGPIVRVGQIAASLSIESLWRREAILSARVVEPDVVLEVDAGASKRFEPFPLPDSIAIGPVRLRLGTVRVTRGHLVLRNTAVPLDLEVRGAEITARPVSGDLDVLARAEALQVRALGLGEQVEKIETVARLAADRVRVRSATWQWQSRAMRLAGDLAQPWRPERTLAFHLEGEVALAAAGDRAGLSDALDGTARIEADISGPPDAIRVTGRVSSPAVGIAGFAVRDVAIPFEWANRQLAINDLDARPGGGRVKGRVTASLLQPSGADVKIALSEVIPPDPLTALGPGSAAADILIRGGAIEIAGAQAGWRDASLTLGGRIETRGSLAVASRLTADVAALGRTLGAPDLAGRAIVTAELSGRTEAPILTGRADLTGAAAAGHAVAPLEARFRLAAVSAEGRRALSRWDGTLESPRVTWQSISAEHVAAAFIVDQSRLELTRLGARVAAIPVEATGAWAWAGGGRAEARLGPVALGAIPAVPAGIGLAGTGRGHLTVKVERRTVSTEAAVDLERVSSAGVLLGDGSVRIRGSSTALTGDLAFPARKLRAET